MMARWQFVFFVLGFATAAFAEIPADSTPAALETESSTEALAAELAALRARVEELERERPSLDMHAFQNECNSSVYCSTKDGKVIVIDPFILKNIKLYPYIKVIKNLIK